MTHMQIQKEGTLVIPVEVATRVGSALFYFRSHLPSWYAGS